MRKSNIIYMLNEVPYPSQPTLCKVLGITPNAFRIKIHRLGGLDGLDSVTVKGQTVTFIKH